MQAIITKYHGATNTKPSKISATASGGARVVISYPHDCTTDDAHKRAAAALMVKMDWAAQYDLVCGEHKTGCVFVMIPKLVGPVATLIEHAMEAHPHFESPRGQADIAAARKAVERLQEVM